MLRKKIKHEKRFLQEPSEETLENNMKEYEASQLEETNKELSLVLTKKFSDLMGAMGMVKTPKKHQNKKK